MRDQRRRTTGGGGRVCGVPPPLGLTMNDDLWVWIRIVISAVALTYAIVKLMEMNK